MVVDLATDESFTNIYEAHVDKIDDAQFFNDNDGNAVQYYKVQWKSTWETEKSLEKFCAKIIENYWQTNCTRIKIKNDLSNNVNNEYEHVNLLDHFTEESPMSIELSDHITPNLFDDIFPKDNKSTYESITEYKSTCQSINKPDIDEPITGIAVKIEPELDIRDSITDNKASPSSCGFK